MKVLIRFLDFRRTEYIVLYRNRESVLVQCFNAGGVVARTRFKLIKRNTYISKSAVNNYLQSQLSIFTHFGLWKHSPELKNLSKRKKKKAMKTLKREFLE